MTVTQEQTGKDWKSISLARQNETNNAIPKSHRLSPVVIESLQDPRNLISILEKCGILSQRELEITSTPSTTKLLADIRNRVYTAVEVTVAFCKRASIAHQLVGNSFTRRLRFLVNCADHCRPIVSPRFSTTLPWPGHRS